MNIDDIVFKLIVPFETYQRAGGELNEDQYDAVRSIRDRIVMHDFGSGGVSDVAISNFINSLPPLSARHFQLTAFDYWMVNSLAEALQDNVPKNPQGGLMGHGY